MRCVLCICSNHVVHYQQVSVEIARGLHAACWAGHVTCGTRICMCSTRNYASPSASARSSGVHFECSCLLDMPVGVGCCGCPLLPIQLLAPSIHSPTYHPPAPHPHFRKCHSKTCCHSSTKAACAKQLFPVHQSVSTFTGC